MRVLREAETPERLDLLGWELADLLDVQVAAEGLDGAGVAGDGACGFGGARFLWGRGRLECWGLWGSYSRCFAAELLDFFVVGFLQGLDGLMSLSE